MYQIKPKQNTFTPNVLKFHSSKKVDWIKQIWKIRRGVLIFKEIVICSKSHKIKWIRPRSKRFVFFSRFAVIFFQGVDFTKLCAPSKKTPAHGIWQKICHSISSTNDQHYNPSLEGKFVLNLPNLCAISQICALVAKCRLPKIASHLVRAYKCWWNRPKVEFGKAEYNKVQDCKSWLWECRIWDKCKTAK